MISELFDGGFFRGRIISRNTVVYLVQPLPQSLLYYVFSFGRIDDNDEKKYIHSIIENLFSKDEKHLYEIATEAISECHKYLRNNYDASVVSLREIARFSKCMEFFQKYFTFKNEYEDRDNNKKNKVISIVMSVTGHVRGLAFENGNSQFHVRQFFTKNKLKFPDMSKTYPSKNEIISDMTKTYALKNEIFLDMTH